MLNALSNGKQFRTLCTVVLFPSTSNITQQSFSILYFNLLTCVFINSEEPVSNIAYKVICHFAIPTRIHVSSWHLGNDCFYCWIFLNMSIILGNFEGWRVGIDWSDGDHKACVSCKHSITHRNVQVVLVALTKLLAIPNSDQSCNIELKRNVNTVNTITIVNLPYLPKLQ